MWFPKGMNCHTTANPGASTHSSHPPTRRGHVVNPARPAASSPTAVASEAIASPWRPHTEGSMTVPRIA